MPPVKWSRHALLDLSRLKAFLHGDNLDAAARAIRTIRHSLNALARHPEIGRAAEGLPEAFRVRVVPFGRSAYVVLYRWNGKQVLIVAVRHGREAGY